MGLLKIMKVEFVQSDVQRIMQAAHRVLFTANKEKDDMPKRAARQYANNIINAINGQKYGWAEHSVYYKGWKYLHNYDPRKWVMTGELLQAITTQKLKSGRNSSFYFAGIPGNIKDSGGKNFFRNQLPQNIAWYARMLEYGRKGQPPRPLFVPEFQIFKGLWRLEMMKARGEIRRAWR